MSITKDGTQWRTKGTVCRSDGSRKHYNRLFSRKADAKAWEQKRREELMFEHSVMTLDELAELKFAKDKARLKESTLLVKCRQYYNHISPRFGGMEIDKIKSEMIEEWLHELPLKEHSANNVKGTFHSVMDYGARLHLIPMNPVASVDGIRKPDKKRNELNNYWTVDEFNQFIESVNKPDDYFFFMLLWNTGIRKGEALGLQWKHYKNGTLKIEQTLSKTGKLTSPKTSNSYRTIYVSAKMKELLDNQYAKMKRYDGFTDDWFITGTYKPMTDNLPNKHLKKYIQKSGVKPITIHGFRHSHASILINNNIPADLIADRLGHTVQMLYRTYAHIYETKRASLTDVLDKLL